MHPNNQCFNIHYIITEYIKIEYFATRQDDDVTLPGK